VTGATKLVSHRFLLVAGDAVDLASGRNGLAREQYDLIVIGSGPGGASLAYRLAPTGKRILILERGEYLPRSEKNWNSQTVFVDAAYQASETWTDSQGNTFSPGLHYYVGGNSKVYGAALLRLRERDFGEVEHAGGVSPAWRWGTKSSNPITPRPSGSIMSMASAVRIRWSHGRPLPTPIRP
jgi:hypothetical protein